MGATATLFLTLIACRVIVEAILFPGNENSTAKRNVFVTMTQGTGPLLEALDQRNFSSRAEKLTALTEGLQGHAVFTQGPLVNFLKSGRALALAGAPFTMETMWISNQLYIAGVNSVLLRALQEAFPSLIASIDDEWYSQAFPTSHFSEKQRGGRGGTWGVNKIQAPDLWRQGIRGQGVVMGIIDTGVRVSHVALKDNYVGPGNLGWFDPSRKSSTPNDFNGHGTHCLGTILGTTNNIGVAPAARWLGCKGCAGEKASCSGRDLLGCGQFMTCPHDPQGNNKNCAKAPHIVSNSWGGNRHRGYDSVVRAWRSGGIIPIFAIGNSGPNCETAGSPGDHRDVIGVGSTTGRDELSRFSSRGSGQYGMKPDISAPGSDVYSAGITGDSSYATMSGTSMACPHVAGVVALMLSGNRNLKYDQIKSALIKGSSTSSLRGPSGRGCGNSAAGRYPNNEFGSGLLNAVQAVQQSKSL